MTDWDDPYAPVPVDTVTLEWIKAAAQAAVSAEFAASIDAKLVHQTWYRLVHQLTARVLADQLPPEQATTTKVFTFEIPATWWQAFKADHADSWWLAWLVSRRPVRTRVYRREGRLDIELRRYWSWPKAKVLPSEWGSPVRVSTLDQVVTWRDLP